MSYFTVKPRFQRVHHRTTLLVQKCWTMCWTKILNKTILDQHVGLVWTGLKTSSLKPKLAWKVGASGQATPRWTLVVFSFHVIHKPCFWEVITDRPVEPQLTIDSYSKIAYMNKWNWGLACSYEPGWLASGENSPRILFLYVLRFDSHENRALSSYELTTHALVRAIYRKHLRIQLVRDQQY
jgi:hypothetical protein